MFFLPVSFPLSRVLFQCGGAPALCSGFCFPFDIVLSLDLLLPHLWLNFFSMPSDLLKCTICPKKPIFSDVSHLLTHVGSKGHLANLHGLQVRSHQELDAGRQLVIYNQWFQEHGVASLLSERMLQKQQKRAVKKDAIKEEVEDAGVSTAHIPGKPRARKAGKNVPKVPAISAYEAQPPNLKTRMSDNDFNDIGPTSVGEIDHSRYVVCHNESHASLTVSGIQAIPRYHPVHHKL